MIYFCHVGVTGGTEQAAVRIYLGEDPRSPLTSCWSPSSVVLEKAKVLLSPAWDLEVGASGCWLRDVSVSFPGFGFPWKDLSGLWLQPGVFNAECRVTVQGPRSGMWSPLRVMDSLFTLPYFSWKNPCTMLVSCSKAKLAGSRLQISEGTQEKVRQDVSQRL